MAHGAFLGTFLVPWIKLWYHRGWIYGGGGGRTFPFLRDPTPCRPKGSPLCTFLGYLFWVTDHKFFLKAPLAPIYTNDLYTFGANITLRGERAPKKRNFLIKIFQKVPKNAFFGLFFFQNFACSAEILAKTGSL